MSPPLPSFPDAARAFSRFFAELSTHFLERTELIEQLELALLCREHVLVYGPPGTAKSQLALAVMKRIVDATSGEPSVFSKQIAETTVQSDLVGPVDFKVLTRSGRTEHLTDEGILGAVHGILDEVFDGREMFLRSLLNLLEEREHKSGHKTTAGRTECTVMTSNRYLSDVVQRNPELMLAFADRISFICFVPKGFAVPASRAEMLRRAAKRERPAFQCALTIQDLDTLQAAVEEVELPPDVLEALERLADALERTLATSTQKASTYRPTKYFSNRTLVKSLKVLKAAVVLDAVRSPTRAQPLRATLADLRALRLFFALGGPVGQHLSAHLSTAIDPRERAQLEAKQLEGKAFSDCLARAQAELLGGVDREAKELGIAELVTWTARAADALGAAAPHEAARPAKSVSAKVKAVADALQRSPRYSTNARALDAALQQGTQALTSRLAQLDVPEASLPEFFEAALTAINALRATGTLPRAGVELLSAAMQTAGAALRALPLELRTSVEQDPKKCKDLPTFEKLARECLARFIALESAVALLTSTPATKLEELQESAETSGAARRECAHTLTRSLLLSMTEETLQLEETQPIVQLEEALHALDPAAPLLREVIAPHHWRCQLWKEMEGARSIAAVHAQLRGALVALEIAPPLAGKLLSAKLPPFVVGLCTELEKNARAPVALPPSALLFYDTYRARFPACLGEHHALAALCDHLAIEPTTHDWRAALQAAARADLARFEATLTFLASWLSAIESRLDDSDPPTLRLIGQSQLPKLVSVDHTFGRISNALSRLEGAEVDGTAALRARVTEMESRTVALCKRSRPSSG